MPFVAECMYCHVTLRGVPDHRLGSSVECPRCRNSFTLVPQSDLPTAPRRPAAAAAETAPVAVAHEPARPATQALPAESDEPAPTLRSVNYAGLAAFLCGSFAFLAAAVFHVGAITVALGLAGILLGLAGFLFTGTGRRWWLLPGAGVAASLPAVVIAVFLPDWLGLSPLWARPRPLAPGGDAVISLSGAGGLRRTAEGEAPWVNASQDALHHGDVRLRIASAAVRPVEFEPVPGIRPPGDRCLVLALRITNAGVARKISYSGWSSAGQSQDRPVLRDNQGRIYPTRAFGQGWVVKGQVTTASIPSGKTLDDVLVFEAPAPGTEYLRLELPASAVGAEGRLRMEIPRSMIAFR
jgi:hypothetical protein